MEYPTLFTGGARYFAPPVLHSPESVTVHEAGHQFWYGLVGNNEFEEAWLDEGFNSYHEQKAIGTVARAGGRGPLLLRARRSPGEPHRLSVRGARSAPRHGASPSSRSLRKTGRHDEMARRAWEYRNRASYGLNSYDKPAASLHTLEALVGDETMTRILRTYARRFTFGHPTSEDFIGPSTRSRARTGAGTSKRPGTRRTSATTPSACATSGRQRPVGFRDGASGPERLVATPAKRSAPEGPWESEVTIERKGEVRMPVEIRVFFEDGTRRDETWDGQYRWKRLAYSGKKVVQAQVDPLGKLAIDVDPANDIWIDEKGEARRAARKWAARYLFWLQNLLELHTVLG